MFYSMKGNLASNWAILVFLCLTIDILVVKGICNDAFSDVPTFHILSLLANFFASKFPIFITS